MLRLLLILSITVLLHGLSEGQEKLADLPAASQKTFTLTPGSGRAFSMALKEGDVANVDWLVGEGVILRAGIVRPDGKPLETGGADNLLFVAPTTGNYRLVLLYDPESDAHDPQNVTVEYRLGFSLPKGSRLKDTRTMAGYTVRIFTSGKEAEGLSTVVFEKSGVKKHILQDYGSEFSGYSFSDAVDVKASASAKRNSLLIRNTPDKTGNGIPDVMLDYFSGGAHCCFTTFFFDLGATVDLAQQIDTQHSGLSVVGVNPTGGLRFETNENNFAYWNTCFACSPMPAVVLEFDKGVLKPNFDLMRKSAPSLASLKQKASRAKEKISLEPYTDDGNQFEEAFWGVMLDLIYSGHEDLAWQYLDLVWPAAKEGKALFAKNFKDVLASSYYGTRDTNSQNGFQNYWKGFNKILEQLKDTIQP